MFKEMLRGFTNFFTSDKVLILVVFLVLVIGLSMYSGSKKSKYDAMTSGSMTSGSMTSGESSYNANKTSKLSNTSIYEPAPVEESYVMSENIPNVESFADSQTASPDTTGLLPSDQNSQWASLNPVNGGNIAAPDLLQAGYNIGLDTIGQTLRNANYQLRSDPIIPKQNVGPWMQSTIEPDLGRVPLEIGGV